MGPIIGMSPDKKAESPGVQEERAGLRGPFGAGTLPEAEGAASPRATSLDRTGAAADDEELTNLNWLHENLLQNFTLGPEAHASGSPFFDIEGDAGAPHAFSSPSSSSTSPSSSSSSSLLGGRAGEKDSLKAKPPFSFSLLIYMAIEQSPGKSLPVKDIYGWILEHFPYFSSAPTGWKNSVRHNLSLNKCFRKVERSLGKANGKGSLWCVDPEYRPNLIQALKKQHFPTAHVFCTPPASPPSASSPPRHLFLQDQSCSLKESDIDAAAAMMLLNSAHGQRAHPCDPDRPMDLSRPDSVLVSSDPKQDHNYSSAPLQRCASHCSSSSLSSLEEGGRAAAQARRAGSEGFHSDEDSDGAEERTRARPPPPPRRPAPPGKKRARRDPRQEEDEELKEAAGSLLHLAGIRCLELSKHGAKSRKLSRK
ncbi:forkhead box protein N2 isoform X1 [Conger conger]|uniref:forkhead box protein N2 isoform X1 n=1 Tax=Conger conger TaxID=82655 RepID=UPI002A5AEEFE|nr:forkhead box protein N2 isoform X1 [Conger conger]